MRTPEFRVVEGLDIENLSEVLDGYRRGKVGLQAIVHPNTIVE